MEARSLMLELASALSALRGVREQVELEEDLVDPQMTEQAPWHYEALGEVGVRPMTPVKPPPIVALDSSSRGIETAYAYLVISTASIVSVRLGVLLDYPPLWFKYPIDVETACPFIAVKAEGYEGDMPAYVATRNPAGYRYDLAYSRSVMHDELRYSLENFMLSEAIARVLDAWPGIYHRLVIVDGPLYAVPRLALREEAPAYYREGLLALIEGRVRAVRLMASKGSIVLGVVKRLDESFTLARVHEVASTCARMGMHVHGELSDLTVLDLLLHECLRRGLLKTPLEAVIVGPFKAKPPKVPGLDLEPKVVAYVVVPKHPYTLRGYEVFRVEALESQYRIFGDTLFSWVIGDAVLNASGLPLSLKLADARCRVWSRMLFLWIARSLEESGIPLSYDSRVEVERELRGERL